MMFSFLSDIVQLGVDESYSSIENRRIRLVNIFSLVALMLILIFGLSNIFLGFVSQGAIILSGIFYVAIPPLLLNKYKFHKWSRHYFMIISFIFIAMAVYNSILKGQSRYNEVFMIGFSAFIIIMFEHWVKYIYFTLWALLTYSFAVSRELLAGASINEEAFFIFINVIGGFWLIHFFVGMFKEELLDSNTLLKDSHLKLRLQQEEIELKNEQITISRKLLRSAIDNLPLFIAMLDMEGKYLVANRRYEETFDLPVEEIEGKHYTEILPESITDIHTAYIEKGLKGLTQEFDDLVELPGGQHMQTLGRYTPIYDEEGKQFALTVYVVDITALKEAEAKLQDLNAIKNKLLGLISHDLRAPLHSLKGIIDISSDMSDAEIRKYINQVSKKLSVVNFSLDNLLNWAKIQMEGFSPQPEAVKLSDQISNNLQLFDEQLRNKNLVIDFQNTTNEPMAWIDREGFNLVLRNVLSNAIKFSPKNSTILLELSFDEKQVTLTIKDQGEGINQATIDALEKGSVTLSSTSGTSGEKGTGLGLSLSADIMRVNGGELNLIRNKTSGTTVTLIAPININDSTKMEVA